MKNYEYSIKLRSWSYAKFLYHSFGEHLKCWLFGRWSENVCDAWVDKGIRFFGIEFNKRIYL